MRLGTRATRCCSPAPHPPRSSVQTYWLRPVYRIDWNFSKICSILSVAMRRFARLSTLFVGFLALQLNALGGGVACLVASSASPTGVVAASMAGMGMAAPQQLHLGAGDASIKSAASPASSQSPCHQSGAPHSSCQSMAPCATAFIAVLASALPADVPAPATAGVLTVLAPLSHSLSPDLPPPKA